VASASLSSPISSSSDSSWDINCISEISRQKFEDGAIKRGANDASATASSWIDFADDDNKNLCDMCSSVATRKHDGDDLCDKCYLREKYKD
jgi:hypothetical protein